MNGEHFYGRNNWGQASNPTEDNFHKWRAAFAGVAADLKALGVEVVNTSMASSLGCFPKFSVGDTLKSWGVA
jgi:hypothetical protein